MSLVESISGKLTAKSPTNAQVQIGGIVYNLNISISTYEKLPELNESVTLLTHLHVKEDLLNLYGFIKHSERSLFLNLNTISGIGPRSAMNILSGTTPNEFKQKIIERDVKSLTVIPGIGAKTAKRIIIELKEKFSIDNKKDETLGFTDEADSVIVKDATNALKSLGYNSKQISNALSELQKESKIPEKLEDMIREVLKHMS
ncbi:MAG: Holliday junction branch migration protein RuvA [Candidatus Neomarinimicrobiota bacterium]|nr:Holliday junction branch migration protein RuvA [Candidatus Neomarinimicrobiota bacterium]